MSDEAGGKRPKLPRTTHLISFLLIVGLALAGWVWYSTRLLALPAPATPAPAAAATAQASPTSVVEPVDAPGDGYGIVPGPATPWAVAGGPGEQPTPAPDPPPPAPIALIGPPPGSLFRMGDGVTFYWSSPEPPGPGRQFTVYLLTGGAQVALGSVAEANLGLGYQLSAVPGQAVEQPGQFSWLIAIEDQASGAIIGQSAVRPLTLIADN